VTRIFGNDFGILVFKKKTTAIDLLDKENPDRTRRESHVTQCDPHVTSANSEMPNRPSGIPKSKSHFSKLKKAYNETTSKVSTVVSAGFRNSNSNSAAELVLDIMAHRDAIQDICALERRPQIFLSASLDKTAKLWMDNGTCCTRYTGHTGAVNSVNLHPTNNLAISGSGDTECHLWPFDINSQTDDEKERDKEGIQISHPLLRFGNHTAVVSSVIFCGCDNICTVGWDGRAQIHDVETAATIGDLCGHEAGLNHCSSHSSNFYLVTTSSRDGAIRVWDYRTNGKPASTVCVSQQHRAPVSATCFLDANTIISSSDDKTVRLFDLRQNRPMDRIGVDSAVNRLSVNTNGITALPHDDRHIRLLKYNSANQTRLRRINRSHRAHQHSVNATAWLTTGLTNTDQKSFTLVSGGWDRKLCVWRVPCSFI
jgi:WD40 repeat protein